MKEQVGAVLERAHQVRRGEGGVDQQRQPGIVRDFGDAWNVEDVKPRVAERFAEDKPRIRADRLAESIHVARIYEGGVDAEARQGVAQQIVRSAIQRAGCDDVRTRIHQRGDGKMQRGLPAGGGNRADPAFQRGDAFFQRRVGRIGDACIDVSRALHVEQRGGVIRIREHVGRGEVNRLRARTELRVRPLPRVQAQRVELESLGSRHFYLESKDVTAESRRRRETAENPKRHV